MYVHIKLAFAFISIRVSRICKKETDFVKNFSVKNLITNFYPQKLCETYTDSQSGVPAKFHKQSFVYRYLQDPSQNTDLYIYVYNFIYRE